MVALLKDLRYTLRVLGRSPGFTSVAVLSLALAIGANTAIFSLLDALLLRDLPVRQPERLVELSVLRRGNKIMFSYPMLRELERGQKIFSGLMGWSFGVPTNVEVNGELSQSDVRAVTGNFFEGLGATPFLGRLVAPSDVDASGAISPVAILSYGYWQSRFGGDSGVVGKSIAIDGQPFTIIGVTRPWFTGMSTGEAPDITIPLKSTEERSQLFVFITGRLKDGLSVTQANAQLQSIWPGVLRATAPTETPGPRRTLFFTMGLSVDPAATGVNASLREHFTKPLYVLVGIVVLILLVACVNLANLLLARAAARGHEVSVRLALGATRWALAREVLTESLALSVSGALLGLAFAYWGSRLLVNLLAQGYLTPVLLDVRPDWRVLGLTATAAIVTGILFGLAPAWRSTREDPASALQQSSRSFTGATGRLGSALIVPQIALSLILLVGAGLLVRSFRRLTAIDPGLNQSVLEVQLYPRPGGYENLDANAYHRQLIERVANLPGVESLGFADLSIRTGAGWQDNASPTSEASNPSSGITTTAAMVSPGVLQTLGVDILRGRAFDWNDDDHHPRVAIISGSLAERLYPADNALGQHIRFSFMPEFRDLEIVGVARDARLFDLHHAAAPVIYLPFLQYPKETQWGSLYVRSREAPESLANAVGQEIQSLGREYPLSARTVAQNVNQALVEDRVIALLSSFFGILGVLLASVGLYGLMSYAVTRRTREIGIRAAMGAQKRDVLWLVLREALTLGVFGIALGIPCALGASRLIAGMLFGISPSDLPTLAGVSLLLLIVALLASYLPARRAARIDPMAALRME